MKETRIEALINPNESDVNKVEDGIDQYNDLKIGKQTYIPVGSFAYLDGNTIGGIKGNLFWNYLYIDIMWIDEKYRQSGLGRKLIEEIEQLSIKNGIYRSHLCTASFQSVGFYEKCGYKIFGQLDDMPEGEIEYYLYKKLKP